MRPYRWKVACINWTHPGAPHAIAYSVGDDGHMIYSRYFPTHAEAIRFADDTARRAHRMLNRILNPTEAVPTGAASSIPEENQ